MILRKGYKTSIPDVIFFSGSYEVFNEKNSCASKPAGQNKIIAIQNKRFGRYNLNYLIFP